MKLVSQHPHPKACVLACIAMLERVTLDTVIGLAGSPEPPDYETRMRIAKFFGRERTYMTQSVPVIYWGTDSLMELMRQASTYIVSVNSCLDPNFAHAAILHERELYDPFYGMNPQYPWDKTITRVYHV